MIKLSPSMIQVLRLLLDGKPRGLSNGLHNVRYPTLVSLRQRGLIRQERNDPHQRIYTMRFIITPQGRDEYAKRVKL